MATISFKCDTCKRSVELVENPQGFTVVGKCVITNGCTGRLYRTERNPNNVRESAPSYVAGLDNYVPRRAFFEYAQTLASDKWTVKHNMGVLPSTFVYLEQDDGRKVLADNSTYTVKAVGKNTILVTFATKVRGIIQCVAKSTVPLVPSTVSPETAQTQVSANGIITFAVPKYLTQVHGQIPAVSPPAITPTITPSPTPTSTPIGLPLNLCAESATIQIEIEITKPNEDPFVCFENIENFTDNRSPWNGWGEVLVGKRRNYCVRTATILKLAVFGNADLESGDIPDGTRIRFLRIDYGTGRKEVIPSRGLLMLLAKSPYAYADKVKNRVVDVGELIGDTPNYFVYRGGELFLDENKVERSYPDISRVIYQAAPPQPSPTPTPTVTPTITATVSITPSVSLSPQPSVTPTPSDTPGVSTTPTPTVTASPTVTPEVTPTLTPTITVSETPTSSGITDYATYVSCVYDNASGNVVTSPSTDIAMYAVLVSGMNKLDLNAGYTTSGSMWGSPYSAIDPVVTTDSALARVLQHCYETEASYLASTSNPQKILLEVETDTYSGFESVDRNGYISNSYSSFTGFRILSVTFFDFELGKARVYDAVTRTYSDAQCLPGASVTPTPTVTVTPTVTPSLSGGSSNIDGFVIAMMDEDAPDGATSMIDQLGRTYTFSDECVVDNSITEFNGSALYIETGSALIDTDVNILSNDFTVEAYFMLNTGGLPGSGFGIGLLGSDNNSFSGWQLRIVDTGLQWVYPGIAAVTMPFTWSVNTFYHVAISREGGDHYLSINGVTALHSIALVTSTSSNNTRIGGQSYGGSPHNGMWIAHRISTNIARYTTDYTVPTPQFYS